MKRTLISLLLLAVVLFTSACSGSQATASSGSHNNIVSVETRKVDNGNKKSKNISSYLTNVDENAEQFVADFDLYQYLIDTGAQSIKRYEIPEENIMAVLVRYQNEITVELQFVVDQYNTYGYLDSVLIYAASSDYVFRGNYTGQGTRSAWYRVYIGTDSMMKPDYDWSSFRPRDFMVKTDDVFYMLNMSGTNSMVSVPDYFDQAYKDGVLPYIGLKDVSYREDPLKDSNDIGGSMETIN
jgi:hypothetical protein